MTDKHPIAHLALVPRDGFYMKDGRGWATSARAHVLDWPWPTTVRGALTTASGKLEERNGTKLENGTAWRAYQQGVALGPTIALRRGANTDVLNEAWRLEHRMWPVPTDALWLEGQEFVQPLDPRPLEPIVSTLGRAADGMPEGYAEARETLWTPRIDDKAKPLSPPRWWEEQTFTAWLAGQRVSCDRSKPPTDQHPRMDKRLQVHVGINADTLTGDDGILFAHDVMETLERRNCEDRADELAEWALAAEVEWPIKEIPPLARLGSDSRIAFVEKLGVGLFAKPRDLVFPENCKHLRLIVVTPACFQRGWLPDGFEPENVEGNWEFRGELPGLSGKFILRAAFVSRPMHISGWDMAEKKGSGADKGGAPKQTSRLVPPGSVYFLENVGGTVAKAEMEALWLAAIGRRTNEGFGRIVPGIWNRTDRS